MILEAYPGSFDPPHRGHIDIIQRAAKDADQLYVLVGKNAAKPWLLPIEKRIALLRHTTQNIKNVTIDSYDGLLVEYLCKKGIYRIVRGLRDDKDLSFEKTQEYYNHWLNPEITTKYIECRDEYYNLSSSAVKDLIARWGNISKMDHLLPVAVKKATEEALNNQFLLGITGVPGSGKSYITQKFMGYCQELGIPHFALEMDKLRHQIALSNDPQFFQGVRDSVSKAFPTVSKEQDGSLSRDSLRATFLGNKSKMEQLEQMTKQSLMSLMRSTLWKKQGAIFVESALFAEQPHLLPIVNNDLLVVEVDKKTQHQRIAGRNPYYDTDEKIVWLTSLQYETHQKVSVIQRVIEDWGYGHMQMVDNWASLADENIYAAFIASMNLIDPLGKLYFQWLWKRLHGKWNRKEAYLALTQQKQPKENLYQATIRDQSVDEWLSYFTHMFWNETVLFDWSKTFLPGSL